MSKEYEIEVDSIESIYKDTISNNYNRKLKVYFSTPDEINEDTGLLTYISGFGEHANSNVCKKMRKEFADKYNLVTIQCDYFGYEFMQDIDNILIPDQNMLKEKSKVFNKEEIKTICVEDGDIDLNKFLNIAINYDMELNLKVDLSSENLSYFNDMGLMQSLDNIIANLSVMNILYNNNYQFNARKNILFGNSHGSYLSYLCNALAPELFSLIIDNSSWVFPQYLNDFTSRILIVNYKNLTINKEFTYNAIDIIEDKEILSLNKLYDQFQNSCRIISYHGITDNLINIDEKQKFCKKINNCTLYKIDKNKIDNDIFKSTNHGLGADFLKLFDLVMNKLNINFEKNINFNLPQQIEYESKKNKYIINYENVLPIVGILPK